MPHVPSQEMNGRFYLDAVRPLLAGIPHAAALLGWGSDVLGYDTERSTDHGYGPRLLIFVSNDAVRETADVLDAGLPETFEGWPVRYGWDAVPVTHHVTVTTMDAWLTGVIGFPPTGTPETRPDTLDWLVMPQQKLLEVTRGRVYADDTGELTALRADLDWYPDQLWRWLLACQWQRISEEEAFVGRTAEVGDELGSRVVAARLSRDIMRLALLVGRRYAPYSKWLGSAFAELPDPEGLAVALEDALTGDDQSRQAALAEAYRIIAGRCNTLGLAQPLDATPRPYYSRPFPVILAGRFADALATTVTDPLLARMPRVGAVDQWTDGIDRLLDKTAPTVFARRLRDLRDWYAGLTADAAP